MSGSKSFHLLPFLHFHRRRIAVSCLFTAGYFVACKKAVNSPNEIIRMGIAGSLSNIIIEAGFHGIDTINVRSKVSEKNVSSLRMVKSIY